MQENRTLLSFETFENTIMNHLAEMEFAREISVVEFFFASRFYDSWLLGMNKNRHINAIDGRSIDDSLLHKQVCEFVTTRA